MNDDPRLYRAMPDMPEARRAGDHNVDPNDAYERLRILSGEYVRRRREAKRAEAVKNRAFARALLEAQESNDRKRKSKAELDPRYIAAEDDWIDKDSAASDAYYDYENERVRLDWLRTFESTAREMMKMGNMQR